jgi:hypothetical protein
MELKDMALNQLKPSFACSKHLGEKKSGMRVQILLVLSAKYETELYMM